MKKSTAALLLAITGAVLFAGCVPMTYTRSIKVIKDASGNITSTEEYEGFTEQHNEGQKIREIQTSATPFKYLKPQ